MLARALLALSIASFIGASTAVDSLAVFADSEDNDNNTFSTGTISIDDAPDDAFLTVANMAPGDTSVVSLEVTNDGSLELRYSLTTSTTDADGKSLDDQLELEIREETVNGCAAEDGALLYDGPLSGATLGSVAQGAQAGDRVLDDGDSETLCFGIELPLASDNSFQDASTTATFTLSAEQTANNP